MHEISLARVPPFPSRELVIAAAALLRARGHVGFDALRLEFDLLETPAGLGANLSARATSLATYALQDPELRIPGGITLQSAIVMQAGEVYRSGMLTNITETDRQRFKAASEHAGRLNDVTEVGDVTGPLGSWNIESQIYPAPTNAGVEPPGSASISPDRVGQLKAPERRGDLFFCKPNFHGIGIDLHELGRRLLRLFGKKP